MAKEVPFVEGYVPIEIIEGALNGGMLNLNSPELLHYFEMVAKHKIFLKNPIDDKTAIHLNNNNNQEQKTVTAVKGPHIQSSVKPVGSAAKLPSWMDKSLSYPELYKRAAQEAVEAREKSKILQMKDYGSSLAAEYKQWCTPELFDYVSMNGTRGEAELRAACYPARVAFSHRITKVEGRWWATPYITVYIPTNAKDAKDSWNVKKGEKAYSFYLTRDREVHCIYEEVEREDTIKSAATKDKQINQSKKAHKDLDTHLRERVFNPVTGAEQYVLLKSSGTEGWQEKYYFKKPDYWKWPEVYDVTNCIHDGVVDLREYWERASAYCDNDIVGKMAIAKIPSIVRSTEGLKHCCPPWGTDYDKNGKMIDVKGKFESYNSENFNNFVHTWSQEEMEREVDYWSAEEFDKRVSEYY